MAMPLITTHLNIGEVLRVVFSSIIYLHAYLLHGSKTSAPALSLFGSTCSGVHMGTRLTFQRSAAPSKLSLRL
ncbi:Endoplasmic reticulum mannosyl-oligosaccharide 1,2-alpha-mannosidase [Fusarium oxysporum f. sp. albedinis]|nr:Endoplasmic reticulum mannosyl-oligosaccharide 1,2-alpha-mannosidase [Fusarium oxysporum f. sp. albedinis]